MQVVRLERLVPLGWPQPAVAVGNFDGVHLGHRALVRLVVADAQASGGTATALTFDPHPSRVLSPDRAPAAIMTLEQKIEILRGLGIGALAVLPFTPERAQQPAEAFAREVLSQAIGARVVVVGDGFRFGRGRAGDVALLERLGHELGFRVHGLPPVRHEDAPISSTRIREALVRGAVEAGAHMLGAPFFVDGVVVQGAGRGRTLGIPTANLAVTNELLPAGGVYACRASVRDGDGAHAAAVVNIGHRPTFGETRTTVEAHLLDFDADLYGRTLRLAFVARLRAERRFPGPHELVAQIRLDVEAAREALGKGAPNTL